MKYQRPEWAANSPHNFGLMSMYDVLFWEQMLKRLAHRFVNQISMLEIGVQGGVTTAGTAEWCEANKVHFSWVGVDLPGAGPKYEMPSHWQFIGEPSEYAYTNPRFTGIGQLGFHILLIDGCHCANHVALDFLNFSPHLYEDGICVFHDSVDHLKWVGLSHPGSHQGHGPTHADFGIGVRAGIKKVGLLEGKLFGWKLIGEQAQGEVQGMMAFQKMT
jgi:hypothetical protein